MLMQLDQSQALEARHQGIFAEFLDNLHMPYNCLRQLFKPAVFKHQVDILLGCELTLRYFYGF